MGRIYVCLIFLALSVSAWANSPFAGLPQQVISLPASDGYVVQSTLVIPEAYPANVKELFLLLPGMNESHHAMEIPVRLIHSEDHLAMVGKYRHGAGMTNTLGDIIFRDVVANLQFARDQAETGGYRLHVIGHSQGGMALYVLASKPEYHYLFEGVSVSIMGAPHDLSLLPRWAKKAAPVLLREARRLKSRGFKRFDLPARYLEWVTELRGSEKWLLRKGGAFASRLGSQAAYLALTKKVPLFDRQFTTPQSLARFMERGVAPIALDTIIDSLQGIETGVLPYEINPENFPRDFNVQVVGFANDLIAPAAGKRDLVGRVASPHLQYLEYSKMGHVDLFSLPEGEGSRLWRPIFNYHLNPASRTRTGQAQVVTPSGNSCALLLTSTGNS